MAVDPEEARSTADEILARPEYREEAPTLVQRAIDWLVDLLGRLFGAVIGGGGGHLIGYLILGLALAAAGYGLWRIWPRYGRLARPSSPPVANEVAPTRGRAEWLYEAAMAEAIADWERAVHARYHALVVGLADAGRLPADESTTSGEHRRAFALTVGDPQRQARFDRVTDRYEHVWFGGSPAARSDCDSLADADQALLGSAR
jgi:hypothetical protein